MRIHHAAERHHIAVGRGAADVAVAAHGVERNLRELRAQLVRVTAVIAKVDDDIRAHPAHTFAHERGQTMGIGKELGPLGIVVNGIAPGETATEILRQREEVLKLGKRYGMACDILDEEVPAKGSYRTLLSSLIMLGMVLLSGLKILPLLNDSPEASE